MKTLKGMAIVIPTYGRVDKQVTLGELPEEVLPFTVLFASYGEGGALRERWETPLIVQASKSVDKIHKKRQAIMEWAHAEGVKKVLMLDDDMFWNARGPNGLRKEYAQPLTALEEMSDILSEFGHAGFSSRMGNNHVEARYAWNTRMMHSLGYNVEAFRKAGARFDRVHGKEDFDVTLQMMLRGYQNVVVYHTAVSPGSYSAPGGCSLERTLESANAAAEELRRRHPDFVKVVEKEYKNHPRKEVQMAWKRAVAAGAAKHGPQWAGPKRKVNQLADKLWAAAQEKDIYAS